MRSRPARGRQVDDLLYDERPPPSSGGRRMPTTFLSEPTRIADRRIMSTEHPEFPLEQQINRAAAAPQRMQETERARPDARGSAAACAWWSAHCANGQTSHPATGSPGARWSWDVDSTGKPRWLAAS
jgi:hypothetical protein